MNIATKIAIKLAAIWVILFVISLIASIPGKPIPLLYAIPVFGVITTAAACFFLRKTIVKPLNQFFLVADKLIDGDISESYDELKLIELDQIHSSLKKIVASLFESQAQISNYVEQIAVINEELNQKVDSLSVLYFASQIMATSLDPDTVSKNFLNIFTEKLGLSGAALMLYEPSTDQTTIKNLTGLSPELFTKFKFYSDYQLLQEAVSSDSCWHVCDTNKERLAEDFDTEELKKIELISSMKLKDHFVGLLLLAGKKSGEPFTETDLDLYKALTGLATTAVNNANLFENSEATKNDLDHKVFNLMTLQQSGKVLSSTLNMRELLDISIDMFLETVWANRGVLMLYGEDNTALEVKASKGITPEELAKIEKMPGESWVISTIKKEKKPVFSQEVIGNLYKNNTVIKDMELAFTVYVPLIREGDLYGIVKIGEKINGQPFTDNDIDFFETLASQAVISLENARLYSLAITDSVTKLYVHRYFQLRLSEEVARCKRYNSTLSLLMCDIDHFKNVNDTYGHQQGDLVLKYVAKILKKNTRNTDIPTRYGGEEFTIILPETTTEDAKIVAERIRSDVEEFEFPNLTDPSSPIRCTMSIGVAGFPLDADNKDQLIQRSDAALYQGKNSGRNRVIVCGE